MNWLRSVFVPIRPGPSPELVKAKVAHRRVLSDADKAIAAAFAAADRAVAMLRG